MIDPKDLTDEALTALTAMYWDMMIADEITKEQDSRWTELFLEEERRGVYDNLLG